MSRYNIKNVKMSVNGLPITSFVKGTDISVTQEGEEFAVTEGVDKTYAVSDTESDVFDVAFSLVQGCAQVNELKALLALDHKTGAGKFPFAFRNCNGVETIFGTCVIMKLNDANYGATAGSVNVRLKVFAEAKL